MSISHKIYASAMKLIGFSGVINKSIDIILHNELLCFPLSNKEVEGILRIFLLYLLSQIH